MMQIPPRSKAIQLTKEVRAKRAKVIDEAFKILLDECAGRITERRESVGADNLSFYYNSVFRSEHMEATGVFASEWEIVVEKLREYLTKPESEGGIGYDVIAGKDVLRIFWE